MQLALNLNERKWYSRYPQSGSFNGWSQWEPLDRQEALSFLEMGYSFEYIN